MKMTQIQTIWAWGLILLGMLFITPPLLSQIIFQGNVKSTSGNLDIANATVELYKVEITGLDTAQTSFGSTITDASGNFNFQIQTGVGQNAHQLPEDFQISANFPNPFAAQTQMSFQVSRPGNYEITVYNILGQKISGIKKTLLPSSYAIKWQGACMPGVYFVVIETEYAKKVTKLVQVNANHDNSSLSIDNGSSTKFLGKTSTSSSYLQIIVSKESFQFYKSALLTYTSQTVQIHLAPLTQEITDARRKLLLEKFRIQFSDLINNLPSGEAAAQMVKFLREQPEIEAADTSGSHNTWARFTDGRLAIYINDEKQIIGNAVAITSPNMKSMIQSQSVLSSEASPQAMTNYKRPSNIPGSNSIAILPALGEYGTEGGYSNDPALIATLCELQGYAPFFVPNVDDLKNMGSPGIFYISSHGGVGYKRDFSPAIYCLWTATEWDPDLDKVYAEDLDSLRLVYMDAPVQKTDGGKTVVQQTRYGFTKFFVTKYLNFAKNSLVFANGCASASPPALEMRDAFYAKNASVYAGFTEDTDDILAFWSGGIFFDRTLGTNFSKDPEPPYYQGGEDPPQRPFDWQSVLSWMQSKGYDKGNAAGTAKLMIQKNPHIDNPCGPLAPSIAFMFVHPYEKTLYLWGIFGDNPGGDGMVTIQDLPMEIQSWQYNEQGKMDLIICKIPDTGTGSSGDVQVLVRGIKSNKTQLSRYGCKFNYTHDVGDGRNYEVKLDLQYRADLLPFRMEAGAKPVNNQPDYVVHADMTSTGESTASGSLGGAINWSGHYTGLYNNIDGSANPRSFIAGAWFDPGHFKMQAYISAGIEAGIIQQAGTQTMEIGIIIGLDIFAGTHPGFPSYFELELDPSYGIKKGTAKAKDVFPRFNIGDTATITWDPVVCENPPKPETPR